MSTTCQIKKEKRKKCKSHLENKGRLLQSTVNVVKSNTYSNLFSLEDFTYNVESVAKLTIDITTLQTDIENKEREIIEKDNTIEYLKTTIEQKNIEIENLELITTKKDSERVIIKTSIAKKDFVIKNLHITSKKMEQEIEDYQEEINKNFLKIPEFNRKLKVQRQTLKHLSSSENNIFNAYQKRILQMSENLQPLKNEKKKKEVELESICNQTEDIMKKIEEASSLLDHLKFSLAHTDKMINIFSDKLYDNIQEQSGKLQCVICREKTRLVTFSPCHHFISCEEYSSKVSSCPICKEIIISRHKTFF
jgi:chromosome segregation ATPase